MLNCTSSLLGFHLPTSAGSSTASSLLFRGCTVYTTEHPDKAREHKATHGISKARIDPPCPRPPNSRPRFRASGTDKRQPGPNITARGRKSLPGICKEEKVWRGGDGSRSAMSCGPAHISGQKAPGDMGHPCFPAFMFSRS